MQIFCSIHGVETCGYIWSSLAQVVLPSKEQKSKQEMTYFEQNILQEN